MTVSLAIAASFDDLRKHVDELVAGEVALVGGGEGNVTESGDEDSCGDERGFHLTEEIRKADRIELLAEIIAEEALASSVDDESRHFREDVDLALVTTPASVDELADFRLNCGAEVGEFGGVEFTRQEVELFAHLLVSGTISDTFTEDGDHKGVNFARAEDLVLVREEGVVESWVSDDSDAVTNHIQGKDTAHLITSLAHKIKRLNTEADEVTDIRDPRLEDRRSILGNQKVEFDDTIDTITDKSCKDEFKNLEEHC